MEKRQFNLPAISLLFIGIMMFTSCKKDDNSIDGSIQAFDQVIPQNLVWVSSAGVKNINGWVIIHPDASGSPDLATTISFPIYMPEGNYYDFYVSFDTVTQISDDQLVWLTVHEDTGVDQEYEYDGSNDVDKPLTINGQIVSSQITIQSPLVVADNQPITSDSVTIRIVRTAVQGWVIVFRENALGNPGEAIGYAPVLQSLTNDMRIEITSMTNLVPGTKLFAELFIDEGTIGVLEYPGADIPEIFGNSPDNEIMTSFLLE